jgi:hypothetical protein
MERLSKIDLNWDFWFENIPSGNPGQTWLVGKKPRANPATFEFSTTYNGSVVVG